MSQTEAAAVAYHVNYVMYVSCPAVYLVVNLVSLLWGAAWRGRWKKQRPWRYSCSAIVYAVAVVVVCKMRSSANDNKTVVCQLQWCCLTNSSLSAWCCLGFDSWGCRAQGGGQAWVGLECLKEGSCYYRYSHFTKVL